jgi:hypothetical protein
LRIDPQELDFHELLWREVTMLIRPLTAFLVSLSVALSGCAVTNQITKTPRSTIEQRLLVQALDRALSDIDVRQLQGKTVAVDFYGLTADKDFAKEYFTAWLQSQGVRIPDDWRQAQLRLKVFAAALGVDQGQSFVGSPSFTVPLIGFVMPEIALFRNIRHSGHAEIKVATIDSQTGEFVDETGRAVGTSRHDDYTLLIIVHFTRTDLEEPQWDIGA